MINRSGISLAIGGLVGGGVCSLFGLTPGIGLLVAAAGLIWSLIQ